MPNTGFRQGDSDPKPYATFSTDVITPGDMLWWDATNKAARPASMFTWTTDLATTQTAFRLLFLGCSNDQKIATKTPTILVNRGGRHDFTCASLTCDPAQLVGPAKATGNALENQKIASVATAALAIGRVDRQLIAAVIAPVEIRSAFTTEGGVKAIP